MEKAWFVSQKNLRWIVATPQADFLGLKHKKSGAKSGIAESQIAESLSSKKETTRFVFFG